MNLKMHKVINNKCKFDICFLKLLQHLRPITQFRSSLLYFYIVDYCITFKPDLYKLNLLNSYEY